MLIPGFGELTHDLLEDREICLRLLMESKHQLLEGIIVEQLFDQWMDAQPQAKSESLKEIRQTTLICQRHVSGRPKNPCAFVLANHADAMTFRFESALASEMNVIPVKYDEGRCEFLTVVDWKTALTDRGNCNYPLAHQLSKWLRTAPRTTNVHDSVRDGDRQKSSFWGFLSGSFGSDLARKVVIPRLFKDFGPQPFFRSGWDVDRILVDHDQLWSLEIKHKYPFGSRDLKFGLNVGELKTIEWLDRAQIKSLHIIVVKPAWSKDESPNYIFNDVNMRSKAIILGMIIDREMIERIRRGRVGSSAAHTTFNGSGKLNYYPIPASAFTRLGLVSDAPGAIMSSIQALIRGEQTELVSQSELYRMRVRR